MLVVFTGSARAVGVLESSGENLLRELLGEGCFVDDWEYGVSATGLCSPADEDDTCGFDGDVLDALWFS